MIQPPELKLGLPMKLANGVVSDGAKVWEILVASQEGDLAGVKKLEAECPELIYAQYNYTPPIHFAVREGHVALVHYLLNAGALDPSYIIYPFKDSVLTIAEDRNYAEIATLLREYLNDATRCRYRGDNGEIVYTRTSIGQEFEQAVDQEDLVKTEKLLKEHPGIEKDETYFWSEGILMTPAKDRNYQLVELLLNHGAKVPAMSKWARYYYFKHTDIAALLLENGMNPNHTSWHHVRLLHDMAQSNDLEKAELLIKHGADINAVEEEYHSTPLGMAARWGNLKMVEFLLKHGADPNESGASWSTPLAWANKKNHAEIVDILKQAGAKS